MTEETITKIFDRFGKKSIGTRTVLQVLSILAHKLAEVEEFPARKIAEHWAFVLTACREAGVKAEDITALVQQYEVLFPDNLLNLYGTSPFLMHAFQVLKKFGKHPQETQQELCALCIVAISKLTGDAS